MERASRMTRSSRISCTFGNMHYFTRIYSALFLPYQPPTATRMSPRDCLVACLRASHSENPRLLGCCLESSMTNLENQSENGMDDSFLCLSVSVCLPAPRRPAQSSALPPSLPPAQDPYHVPFCHFASNKPIPLPINQK